MLALLGSALAMGHAARAQDAYQIPDWQESATLTGEVYFRERTELPPDAVLHVSVSGRVSGAEYLPLATGVFYARDGVARFEVPMPDARPAPPYRVQALMVSYEGLYARSFAPQTLITDPNKPLRIRMKLAPMPRSIVGDRSRPKRSGQRPKLTPSKARRRSRP